jgi:hypothetical protein
MTEDSSLIVRSLHFDTTIQILCDCSIFVTKMEHGSGSFAGIRKEMPDE